MKILGNMHGTAKLVVPTLRIKNNEELDNLIEHKNIIHFIKARILRWLSHV
jgi:hypothetical protein